MASLLARFEQLRGAMEEHVAELASIDSPSGDPVGLARCADAVSALGRDLLGVPPDDIGEPGSPVLRWRFGSATRVLVVGHLDTVWPAGTTERWPVARDGDRLSGPGVFDMKAGIVQGLHALSALDDLDGVTVLFTSDEEVGSPRSRPLIEREAAGAEAALVLEPSAHGALKVARKGVSMYQLAVEGRSAHAGLEPEKGANALVELAHHVIRLDGLARPDLGTTVTPTVASAGTTTNTVPAYAQVHLDVRVSDAAEQERVHRELGALHPVLAGTAVRVTGGPNRPPMPESSSRALFGRAVRVAAELGLAPPEGVAVGGGSDGNFTAGLGIPTLDGLGAVGDHAHAEGEYVVVDAMAPRAALFCGLVRDVLAPVGARR